MIPCHDYTLINAAIEETQFPVSVMVSQVHNDMDPLNEASFQLKDRNPLPAAWSFTLMKDVLEMLHADGEHD